MADAIRDFPVDDLPDERLFYALLMSKRLVQAGGAMAVRRANPVQMQATLDLHECGVVDFMGERDGVVHVRRRDRWAQRRGSN